MNKSKALIIKENKFTDFSNEYIPQIDNFIDNFFAVKTETAEYKFIEKFYQILSEYCGREGKRIRPLLVLLSYSGYKRGRKNLEEIIKIAAAMEIMHSFLLIQDDIIDNAELRRGGETLHLICREKYMSKSLNPNIGNDIALVLADVLLSNAIEIISSADINLKIKNNFLKQFGMTYELTAWGQILDSINTMPAKPRANSADPTQIAMLKTAYYTIVKPLTIGYVLSGGLDKKIEDNIKEATLTLGLAFQIRDDILGITGNKEDTGKPDDSDIIEGKYTLLIQNTIRNLDAGEKDEFIKKFSKNNKTKKDIAFIRESIVNTGAIETATNKILELTSLTRRKLPLMKIGKKERRVLLDLADIISTI